MARQSTLVRRIRDGDIQIGRGGLPVGIENGVEEKNRFESEVHQSLEVRRKREVREWDERYGKLTDLSAFSREILPRIQGVPLSRLVHATGLSLRYCSLIRRGEKVPHPRHWNALARCAIE